MFFFFFFFLLMVWNYYFISARWLPPLRINKVKVKSKRSSRAIICFMISYNNLLRGRTKWMRKYFCNPILGLQYVATRRNWLTHTVLSGQQSSRHLNKGWGIPPPIFFRLFGLQFSLKIREGPALPGPSSRSTNDVDGDQQPFFSERWDCSVDNFYWNQNQKNSKYLFW